MIVKYKKLFFVFLIICIGGCKYWSNSNNQSCFNVVVIDREEILKNTTQGQKNLKIITTFDKKLIDALDVDQKSIAVKEKDLLKKSNNAQELKNMQNDFFLAVKKTKELIHKHQNKVTSEFFNDVMTRWSNYQSCDLVLDGSSNLVLYSKNSFNVTDNIVDQLQEELATHDKCYETESEIQELFKKLGLIYLKDIKIDESLFFVDLNAYKTMHYQQNQKTLDMFSKSYQKDLAVHAKASFCVKWISDEVGFGVFATNFIRPGQFIQEYTGILRMPNALQDDTSYAWDYPVLKNHSKLLFLDSKFQGNEMRFVNHSDNPNAVRSIFIGPDNFFHVCYVAKNEIQPGQQILVSYGKAYWQDRKNNHFLNF